MNNETDNRYRVEHIAECLWVCVRGEDYDHAKIYGSRADATSAASSLNLWAMNGGEG